MVTRITIDLPESLAQQIVNLADTHLRYPKQQILWLLQEAVRTSTEVQLPSQPEQGNPDAQQH